MNTLHRRKFLQLGLLSSAIFVMQGCELKGITTMRSTIELLQRDLFEKSHTLNIKTTHYFYNSVLGHSRISQEEKKFLKNGVSWLNEAAQEQYKLLYVKLPRHHREHVLQTISQSQWGEEWLSKMLGYILEATLSDPIYLGNTNENGWKWLEFQGGVPHPKEPYL
ncbi:MAG: gluconate 2-dehydrogenase subunit 3 family protein [Campylobacterales bacterium]|nr:gluconate 2-dehydrogenase subunit 3 family protein [Campylobacterales bacterium]